MRAATLPTGSGAGYKSYFCKIVERIFIVNIICPPEELLLEHQH